MTSATLHRCSIAALALCLSIHLLALVLTAAYNASNLTYTDLVSWKLIFSLSRAITPSSISTAFSFFDLLFVLVLVVAAVVLLRTKMEPRSLKRILYFSAQPILFFPGWIGLVFLITTLTLDAPIDGEWFGEWTPKLIAYGIWIVVSLGIAILSYRFKANSSPKIVR